MAWTLARSAWPRSGGDAANTRASKLDGPTEGRVVFERRLSRATRSGRTAFVVAADGSLRAVGGGRVFALDLDGRRRWVTSILEHDGRRARRFSTPTALANGSVVLTAGASAVVIAKDGTIRRSFPVSSPDDSGPSPAIAKGALLVTSPLGEVYVVQRTKPKVLGYFGYDIVPPAVYADGTIGIAGYAGKGFVRAKLDGSIVFRTSTKTDGVDLVPAVNGRGVAAVGALGKGSYLVSPNGRVLATHPSAGVFAVLDDEWIVMTKTNVARLDRRGEPQWTRPLGPEVGLGWGTVGPVVDRARRIYVPLANGVVCFDERGAEIFRCPLDWAPEALGIVAKGALVASGHGRITRIA